MTPDAGFAEGVRHTLAQRLGVEIPAEEGFRPCTLDVPSDRWVEALSVVRDACGCRFFDWLSAVDEGDAFTVYLHVARLEPSLAHLLLRTTLSHDAPRLATATGVFAGASWHERETYEMFGIDFEGHPDLKPLLLPEEFVGHPLRKDFVLASRVAKAWPGAKEPGESDAESHRAPGRRRVVPPGVPAPDEWGPRAPGAGGS